MSEVRAEIAVGDVLFASTPDQERKTANAMSAQDIRDLKAQIIATFVELPRLCPRKRCRRRGRCLTAGAPCLNAHAGLVSERLRDLLWPEGDRSGE